MTTTVYTPADELRFRLKGGLYESGDPEYEDTRTLFNSMIDKRPRYVARCAAPDDVVAALAFGREHGLDIAVRAGGHSVTGASLNDDGLVIDVRLMNGVHVDPERRIARVGAGCVWSEVDRATQEHGLATTGGRVSTTGVAGLTLGGGSGWLERKHGLTIDNVLAIDLVSARGELVRASADENPELFWALRGGGGNFGVVTAFEFRLHPVGPEVFAGFVLHPADRAREAFALFRDTAEGAPEELGLAFDYFTAPAEEGIPEELHGKHAALIAGMYAGPVKEGEEAFRAVREFGPPAADFFEPMPYADFNRILDDPPGYRNWWTAEQVHDLPDEAIDSLISYSRRLPAGPSQLFVVPWGGAVRRVGPGESPLAGRDARFIVHPLMLWEDAAYDEEAIALGRGYRDVLRPYATGDTYLNFVGDEGQERVRGAFGETNYARLARVKDEWDPDNVFHGNQSVRPRSTP